MSLSDATRRPDRLLDSLATFVPFVRRDLVLRNYDDERRYEVRLSARDDDGVAFRRRYSLEPGESRTERAVLEPGAYEVTVESTDDQRSARCRVGSGGARTIRVEAGNGTVTVSDGVS